MPSYLRCTEVVTVSSKETRNATALDCASSLTSPGDMESLMPVVALPVSVGTDQSAPTLGTTKNSTSISGVACKSSTPVSRKVRSEEHTSELQSRGHLVCRLL